MRSAQLAIIVYGKRADTTITVCTDNHWTHAQPQHRPPTPRRLCPAIEAKTQKEAEERQHKYEQECREYEQERERKAEESRL
jgi:ParB family transcriptional regulator, chromosome partitioning protein